MHRVWLYRQPKGAGVEDPDLLGILHIMEDRWDDMFCDALVHGGGMRQIVYAARQDRNGAAHNRPFPPLLAYQAVERIETVMVAIGAHGTLPTMRARKEMLRSLSGR